MEVLNYLLGYKNLKVYQDTEMFNFSLDSVLLANFVTINKKVKSILDIGTGNAVIPIILSTRTDAYIKGVDIQTEVALLGHKSVAYNNLENQIEIINDDINELNRKWETEKFDIITCNPPFFKVLSNSRINNSEYKVIARHEIKLNLEQLMSIAKKLLKNNGSIAIVHRPERLFEIVEQMRKNNIEPKKIQLVYPKKNKEANIVLIEGTKNGKPGLKVLSPLLSHQENGEYTKEIEQYFC